MAHSIDMEQLSSYWDTIQKKKQEVQVDHDQLTGDLIKRLGDICTAYEQICLDKERQEEYARTAQQENRNLKSKIEEVTKQTERDTSVLVLVDGDGFHFDDAYIREGETGGVEAAQMLYEAISQYAREKLPSTVPSDVKILVRVYANMPGLAKTYVDAGVVSDYGTVHAFARGFTKARAHFDFVDCGAGKERADNKIRAAFNLYINNMQTRHIVLACSHDNGYARLVEDLPSQSQSKITLLEGVPFARELSACRDRFQINATKFDGLFRSTKLESNSNYYNISNINGNGNGVKAANGLGRLSPPPGFGPPKIGTPPPSQTVFSPRSIYENGVLQNSSQALPARSASTASDSESSPALSKAALSKATPVSATTAAAGVANWAGRASAAATLPQTDKVGRQQQSNGNGANGAGAYIRRNRRGMRLDPVPPATVNPETVRAVQNMKLCNNFYLKRDCKFANQGCSHDHYYKPSATDLEALRLIARRIQCINRGDCADPRCTAGHRCPWISGGICHFRDNGSCKFDDELHFSDVTEVKTTLVR